MNCWQCDRPAHGVCRFCGRGTCRDHARKMPYIMGIYQGENGEHKAVVVEDALYCGQCKPREDPVALKGLR
ncbi:MAG: hypothetical protein HZB20_14075 [Chloroflexi bacterium]|nr:hypothetical protein [Chloroflexota bacterium]